MTTLIRDALLFDPGWPGAARGPVDIRIEDGVIAAVAAAGTTGAGDAEVIEASGMLAMPGLVNGHLHSSGLFHRGSIQNLPLELFMLWEVPPVQQPSTPPELHRARVLLGAIEMLKRGITAVLDDPIITPLPDDATIDAVMGAYRDAGIRATVGFYQPNRPELEWLAYLREVLPDGVRQQIEEKPRPTTEEILDVCRRFVERWDGGADGRLRCAVSCSAPQRATDDYMRALHVIATENDLPFVLHVLESKAQRVTGTRLYGGSLMRRVFEMGVLDERAVVVHAVWIDEDDIADLAAAGATVVHSPAGNLRCGSGIMPFRDLADAGVPIALCTDEATVEEMSSLWNVGRLAAQLHTLTRSDHASWPRPEEILRSMTMVGARAMRLEGQIGTLAEGSRADMLLLDLSASTYTPMVDLASHLVYGEDGSSIRLVMVDGKIVVRDGAVRTVDEAAVLADVRTMLPDWLRSLEPVDAWARRLRPYVEAVYRRCAEEDVGFTRWANSSS
jgi:5-methylthioadenosine/S-adenosylhomocysteine deaminase